MATEINLASQRLQVIVDGVLISSITYTNIDSINPIKEEVRVAGQWPMQSGTLMQAPTIGANSYRWLVEVVLRDRRREYIRLGGLTGDGATWANTQAGFEIAENAIYAAFP